MKVLQVNAVVGTKSTGRAVSEMAEYLNERGHCGLVAYSEGLTELAGYQIGTLFEKKVHALLSRITGKQAYFSKRGTLGLLKYMNEVKPDIVVLHNLHANYINLTLLLEYLAYRKIPTVLVLHDCWFFTGKCTHYNVNQCLKCKEGVGKCKGLRKDNPSWFLDQTSSIMNDKKRLFESIPHLAVIGVSDWMTQEASQSLLAGSEVIKRIYNWVDLSVFKIDLNISEQRNPAQFNILAVASTFSKSKGIDKLIELSYALSEDMTLTLVGSVSHRYKLPKNIIHIKETESLLDLVFYYNKADVLINFSIEESFGKVSAEALACGTPIITMNSTANPELVGPGCGYVAPDSEIETVMDLIHLVRVNGKESYSEDCRSFAQVNFDMTKNLNEYMELFHSMIKS